MAAADERTRGGTGYAHEPGQHHERRLKASHDALERANQELESRLAELYFMHEFLRALTAYHRVEDVSALIADGATGILGAEIAAVYLLDTDACRYRLAASHGRSEDMFSSCAGAGDSWLLDAAADSAEVVSGNSSRPSASADSRAPSGSDWLLDPTGVRLQAAVALRAGGQAVGVLALAFLRQSQLGPREVERLEVVGEQSALALKTALLNAELERLSVTDRLTELYNHGYLKQRLDQEVQRALRFGHTLSLIMLDIDDFKAFNDRYGHPKGDEVLQGVSALIRENLRDMDVAARYGGEEFVAVLPETDRDGALAVAERIRRSIEGHGFPGDGEARVLVTVSVGVATYPTDARTADTLIQAADVAMYLAKRSGKNQVKSTSAT